MTDLRADQTGAARRGRPPSTSRRELRMIALRLFTERGFENTTIEQIAAEAGVSERTFFRYFTTKASVLWTEFETEVETIRASLAAVGDEVPMMDAIRCAVVAANHYHADDVPEMRQRMMLIATVPALSFSAAEHYEACWLTRPCRKTADAIPYWLPGIGPQEIRTTHGQPVHRPRVIAGHHRPGSHRIP